MRIQRVSIIMEWMDSANKFLSLLPPGMWLLVLSACWESFVLFPKENTDRERCFEQCVETSKGPTCRILSCVYIWGVRWTSASESQRQISCSLWCLGNEDRHTKGRSCQPYDHHFLSPPDKCQVKAAWSDRLENKVGNSRPPADIQGGGIWACW